MQFGSLQFEPAGDRLDLVAEPVRAALSAERAAGNASGVQVAEIDPEVADTAAFCERYGIAMAEGANCVVIAAKRGDVVRHAVCLILATDRIDVNGAVRKHLDAKKASFAAMDTATSATGMEYGGITPIGLPAGWLLLVDAAVAASGPLIIGSGLRRSKLLVSGAYLAGLPGAQVLPIAKEPKEQIDPVHPVQQS
ncbi:YbaK/EbsC family protein [Naasia sp.]|uniref:YbaK/EbsC family protein n=1 Tax=Naasia sp. TaxID=2546198 RepID=UPI00262A05B1|nr:YbaK/EbsC family protein [Naasia sp.]